MSKRRAYLVMVAGLALLVLADVLWPDHHHAHFPWHRWPGFEVVLGLAGAVALMAVSLALGGWLLWRDTCSVLLRRRSIGGRDQTARVQHWLVSEGDAVAAGEGLVSVLAPSGTYTVSAPTDGVVDTIFYDVQSEVATGQTLVNLRVPRHAAGSPPGEEGADG